MRKSKSALLVLFLVLAVFGGACDNGSYSPTAPVFESAEGGEGQVEGGEGVEVGEGFCADDPDVGSGIPRCGG